MSKLSTHNTTRAFVKVFFRKHFKDVLQKWIDFPNTARCARLGVVHQFNAYGFPASHGSGCRRTRHGFMLHPFFFKIKNPFLGDPDSVEHVGQQAGDQKKLDVYVFKKLGNYRCQTVSVKE
jgi:hypothetical protein